MSGRHAGFTLIEMAIVMLIIALAAIVAIPAWRAVAVQDDVTQAQGRFQDLFQLARDSAIASGRTMTVVVDSATAAVWLEVEARPGGEGFATPIPTSAPGMRSADRAPGVVSGAFPNRGRSRFDPTPEGATSLGLPESVRVMLPRARGRFTFLPGGQAFSDSLVLSGIGGRRVLSLALGTGDVLVR